VFDCEGNWRAFNQAARESMYAIYGVEPRVGQNLFSMMQALPDQLEELKALLAPAQDGEEYSVVQELGDPDLQRRTFEMKLNVLRRADGVQDGIYLIAEDL